MPTERDAADLRGPYGGELATVAPGTTVQRAQMAAAAVSASSAPIDMSGANYFGGAHYQNRFVRIICDQNLFYFWSNNASAIVDDAAKDGANRDRVADNLPANFPREEVPSGRYLIVKAGGVGTVRVSIVQTCAVGQ